MILLFRVLVNILELFRALIYVVTGYIILSFYPSSLCLVFTFFDSCSVIVIFSLNC